MTVCAAFWVVIVKIAFRAPSFTVNSIFELYLRCFFSVDFVGSGMLRDVLPAKSSARSSTPSVKSVAANSKRG